MSSECAGRWTSRWADLSDAVSRIRAERLVDAAVGHVRDANRETFHSAVLGDGLVGVHTVDAQENPLFPKLLLAWVEKTSLPERYNTLFNLIADPMVSTPRDAVGIFYSSGIDAMLVGGFLPEEQAAAKRRLALAG